MHGSIRPEALVSLTANTLIFRLLLALVLLAPLPLGSNRPWAWSLLAVLVGLLLGAWSLLALTGRCRAPVPTARLLPAAVVFCLALAWAALQTSSLVPPGWWHPLWAEAAVALGAKSPVGMVSVDPALTVTAILRMACYGAVFWLAVQLGRERARAHEALVAVVLAGLAYALYGLIVHFSGSESLLGLKKWAYHGDLTSSFVNRNAYGAYAGLGVVCSVALFIQALRPRRSGEQRRVAEWTETVLVRAMPYLVAAAVLGTALLLSHSRGAFMSSGVALAVLMAALLVGRVIPPRLAVRLSLAIVAVGATVLVMSGDVTVERLTKTGNAEVDDGRTNTYRLSTEAIEDAPWTGHGLGAFQPAFRLYRDTSLPGKQDWQYAHNVHLETVMDLGLPATVALYGAFVLVLGACARGLTRRRRDHVYPATALAGASLLAIHGAVDFSVQMPAIAVTLALLLGIGFAQSWSSRDATPLT